jgi:hypothetical protein
VVLAHPLDSAPGRFMIVRAREALDNLDQVGALGVGQRVLASVAPINGATVLRPPR